MMFDILYLVLYAGVFTLTFITILCSIFSDPIKKDRKELILSLKKYKIEATAFLIEISDFTDRNDLMEKEFLYGFTFKDCIDLVSGDLSVFNYLLTKAAKFEMRRESDIDYLTHLVKSRHKILTQLVSSQKRKYQNPLYNKDLNFDEWIESLTRNARASRPLYT